MTNFYEEAKKFAREHILPYAKEIDENRIFPVESFKEMMDMEGLKEWVVGRITGFEQITKANEYLNFFKSFYV